MKKILSVVKKKHHLILALIICLVFFVSKKASAAYIEALQSPGLNVTKWSDSLMEDSFNHLTKRMVGLYDPDTGEFVSVGLAPKLFSFTGNLYRQKPSLNQEYLARLHKRSGFIPQAYAQGRGWRFLSTILSLWVEMRNLAYLFFVVVFVIIGFMVMFRKKIDPQTVISVQNALPKIVVSLLLVTFSFAICGLLVDFVWVGNRLVDSVLTKVLTNPNFTYEKLPPDNPDYDIFVHIFGWAGSGATKREKLSSVVRKVYSGLKDLTMGKGGQKLAGFLDFIIAFIILSSVIKILLALVTQYVAIIIQTIFSPFIFLFGSFKGEAIGGFFRQFIASVLSFPAIYAVLNLSSYFATRGVTALEALPPLVIDSGQSNVSQSLSMLFGVGLLMAAPSIPNAIEKALQTSSPLQGAGMGEFAGALRKIPIIGQLLS